MKPYQIVGIVVLFASLGVVLVLEGKPKDSTIPIVAANPHSGEAMANVRIPPEAMDPMAVIEEVTQYLKENPDDPEALMGIANAKLKVGQYDDAMRLFEKVLMLDPSQVDARTNLAIAKLEQGQPDAARALLEKNLETAPDNPSTLLNLGVVYLETGKIQQAISVWERWLEADLHSPYQAQIRARVEQLKSRLSTTASVQ